MRDCDQVLPTLWFGLKPAHTAFRAALTNGRTTNCAPSCYAGAAKKKSERTCSLATPLAKEIETGNTFGCLL
jgi:hypothetical protein